MADIYIVYAGEDREVAKRLHAALSIRWSVWWDADIVGPYPKVIEREMPKATCVVYLNSAVGREKDTVIAELGIARRYTRTIITVRLDDTDAPYPLGLHSAVSLENWSGDEGAPGFKLLTHKISQVVPPRQKPRRPVSICEGRLKLPSLFMSVSSYETQLAPEDAVNLARVFGAPAVLISAYDWAPGRITPERTDALSALRERGTLILMDSGNYEAMRSEDETWKPDDFAMTLATAPHDLACAFDVLPVPGNPEEHFEALVAGVARDAAFTSSPIVPVVHSPRLETGGYDLQHLPRLLHDMAKKLYPPLLAVPERELGEGLIERVRAMQRLRQALDALPFYQPVHLLGTGNPWSIAALTAAGADSFDGLEWCRVVVDRDTHRLNHFQHYDLFAAQTAVSPIAAALKNDPVLPFGARAALHNLDYYSDLSGQLQSYATKDKLEILVTGLLGGSTTRRLADNVPGLF